MRLSVPGRPLKPAAPSRPANANARFAAFASPAFRTIWIGLVLSNVGGQMQVAAQGWLVRDLDASPIYLGLVALAQAIPLMFLTPFGGAVADRFPLIKLLKFTQTAQLVQTAVLAILTLGGWIQLWQLLALSFVYGLVLAVDNPCRQALIPDLVPREHLSSAVSLFSIAWSGSGFFGPALAGILLGPLGAGGLFALNAVSFLAIIVPLFHLPPIPFHPPRQSAFLANVAEGFCYAFHDPLIRTVLLLLTLSSIFGRGYVVLMPIFARDVLHVGEEAYGWMLASVGGGAIIGGLSLAAARSVRRKDVVLVGGLLGFSLFLMVFVVSRSLPLSLACLVLSSAFNTLYQAAGNTLLQLHAPPQMRGRVMALAVSANLGFNSLGGMMLATAADTVSAPVATGIGGAVVIILALGAALQPAWRRLAVEGKSAEMP